MNYFHQLIISINSARFVCGSFLLIILIIVHSCRIQRWLDGRQDVFPGVSVHRTDTHLHVKKHDGYDRPLGGFVDDVRAGEPVVDKNVKIT